MNERSKTAMTHFQALEFIASRGVTTRMTGKDHFELDGFYKSGDALVVLGDTETVIKTRYNRVDVVPKDSDLVEALIELNDEWHEHSKDRFEGWKAVDPAWQRVREDYQC
jgi:hypothetical protein